MKALIALLTAASLSGCANMTPEQRSQFGRDLAVGIAAGTAAGAAARPVYQVPVYQMPIRPPMQTTNCYRYGNQLSCTSW